MYIAICDDSINDAMRVEMLLSEHHTEIFSSPFELLSSMENKSKGYDLYLLDIYMSDDADGLELAKKIREIDRDSAICFISSSNEFYREAYDLQDVNYILKPVSADALKSLVERTERRQTKNKQKSFCYKRNGATEAIAYSEILYINSNDHILDIHLKDGQVKHCNSKLDDIEPLLDSKTFFRCHQSFIVNLYNIDRISGSDFMFGDVPVSISRRYLTDAKRRYSEILFEGVM